MLVHISIAVLQASHTSRTVSHWFLKLGGIGLIPLGLLDSSVIPVPGSLDLVTVLLAAHDRELWPYYSLMATIGSVVGGYLTYRLAQKHGTDRLAKLLPRVKKKKFYALFERWGAASIVIPAMLPPPMPMVPFILAAGASKYSWRKFLTAFTIGRAVRFTALGYLGARYGRHIVRLFSGYGYPILYGVIALTCVAAIVLLIRKYARKLAAS
jgi:membrane protein DedA with SNARE-associated domain